MSGLEGGMNSKLAERKDRKVTERHYILNEGSGRKREGERGKETER